MKCNYFPCKERCKVVPVHVMKPYRGSRIQLHSFLTSALDGGGWSTLCPGQSTSGKNLSIQWIGSWVDPRATLNDLKKRKTLVPARIQMLDHPACNLFTLATPLFWVQWLSIYFVYLKVIFQSSHLYIFTQPLTNNTQADLLTDLTSEKLQQFFDRWIKKK